MSLTPYYAWAPTLDARVGQPVVTAGNWKPGSPVLETVKLILRTPKGSYLPDSTIGVDYSLVQKGDPDCAARFRAALYAAFKTLVETKTLVDLACVVQQSGTTLLYEVSFDDPKLQGSSRRQSVRGQF